MITERQADLIINSWASLAGREFETMASFYNALFKKAPEVRFYFPDDMNQMAEKLHKTIDIVVANAYDMSKLIPELHALGRYHKNKIGIEPSQYPLVINCLQHAIKRAMGDAYTDEIGQSWRVAFVFISRHMIAAPPKTSAISNFFKSVFSFK